MLVQWCLAYARRLTPPTPSFPLLFSFYIHSSRPLNFGEVGPDEGRREDFDNRLCLGTPVSGHIPRVSPASSRASEKVVRHHFWALMSYIHSSRPLNSGEVGPDEGSGEEDADYEDDR